MVPRPRLPPTPILNFVHGGIIVRILTLTVPDQYHVVLDISVALELEHKKIQKVITLRPRGMEMLVPLGIIARMENSLMEDKPYVPLEHFVHLTNWDGLLLMSLVPLGVIAYQVSNHTNVQLVHFQKRGLHEPRPEKMTSGLYIPPGQSERTSVVLSMAVKSALKDISVTVLTGALIRRRSMIVKVICYKARIAPYPKIYFVRMDIIVLRDFPHQMF